MDIGESEEDILLSVHIDDNLLVAVEGVNLMNDNKVSYENDPIPNILLLQEIKNLFQRPPHELEHHKANDLAKSLIENGSYDERLRKIGDAVHFLYPLDLETDRLALWRLALKDECMLRDYLLEELQLLFHNRTSAELAREEKV